MPSISITFRGPVPSSSASLLLLGLLREGLFRLLDVGEPHREEILLLLRRLPLGSRPRLPAAAPRPLPGTPPLPLRRRRRRRRLLPGSPGRCSPAPPAASNGGGDLFRGRCGGQGIGRALGHRRGNFGGSRRSRRRASRAPRRRNRSLRRGERASRRPAQPPHPGRRAPLRASRGLRRKRPRRLRRRLARRGSRRSRLPAAPAAPAPLFRDASRFRGAGFRRLPPARLPRRHRAPGRAARNPAAAIFLPGPPGRRRPACPSAAAGASAGTAPSAEAAFFFRGRLQNRRFPSPLPSPSVIPFLLSGLPGAETRGERPAGRTRRR